MTIKYKSGYKYQLLYDITFHLPHGPDKKIELPYAIFYPNGNLTIKSGYAWDGPSGPTIDTKSFMQGSLAHDVLYQFIREGLLEAGPLWYKFADSQLAKFCMRDGMCKIRVAWVWAGVRIFGARVNKAKKIHIAP